MLKIKDNVDLKELENYGFTVTPSGTAYSLFKSYPKTSDELDITIIPSTRELDVYVSELWLLDDLFDSIFDLIKAGLVEKVEGE